MTVTFDLPPSVEQAYLNAARDRGVPLEEIVREVVIASQPVGVNPELSPEEWVREFKSWALSHDADHLPLLSDEAISRESIYE